MDIETKEKRLLYEFLIILEKTGYKKAKNQGLTEFVEVLPEEDIKDLAREFVKVYQACYYKDKDFTKEDLEKLTFLLESLKKKLKREEIFCFFPLF
jgi:hypothetical protein